MSLREPRGATHAHANEQLRIQWENWLWRSLIAAVAIHAAAFVFWPPWSASSFVVMNDEDPQVIRLEWIVYDAPATQSGILPIAQAGDDGMDAEMGGGDDGAAAEAEIRIRERARELFAEMLPDGELPAPTTADHEPVTIEEQLSSQDLLLSASLSMDRLAALEPELALSSTWVNWPLIRNPAVVTRFLRTRYDRVIRSEGNETVWVSVAMWVNERGSVEWAEVLDSSGQSEVDDIALDMFKDVAVFLPGHLSGVPSSKSMVISVGFPF